MRDKGKPMRKPSTATLLLAITIGACGGSSTPLDGGTDGGLGADGGVDRPVVTISANPPSGMVGTQVTFTGTIAGGTAPYLTCTWVYEAGASRVNGTITGSTCTGQHTYNDPGSKVVTVEVTDSVNRLGFISTTYNVLSEGGTGGQPDLRVKAGTLALVGAPADNRYAPGATIQFAFSIQNTGQGNAGASMAEVKLKNLSTSAEVSIAQLPVNALASNMEQAISGSGTIPAAQPTGPYTLVVTADSQSVVAEENESNNSDTLVGGFAVGLEGDGG